MDLKSFVNRFMPFTKRASSGEGLAVAIVFYIIISIVAGLVIWLAGAITGLVPVLGWIIGFVLKLVSSIIGLYCLAGIIFSILYFLKVIDL